MDQEALNERCVSLMQNRDVLLHMWHPRMFWEVGSLDNPQPRDLLKPKVDLCELEVMLSAAAHVPSMCLSELEQRSPDRAHTIVHMIRRGEMPFLDRPEGS